ncbi:MAG: penicillin-binding transpeptidase domain-containing protein [Thermomicrobiales bacterium]
MPTRWCAPASTRACNASSRPGSRRCWTAPAPRPGWDRAPWWCWRRRPGWCGPWPGDATGGPARYNRAVVARRQPGSAFKPFVWLAALEAGLRPDDTVLDAPIRVGAWSPTNFDGRFRGEVSLETALAESLNTTAVRLMQTAGGPKGVAAVARRLGITDTLPNNATLALGTAEVGLLEMAAAYATFFNGGVLVTPTGIAAIAADGRALALPRTPPQHVADADVAAMMARMLSAVVSRGTGRAATVPGRTIAGKTGTTQDYRDAWFIGWTGGTIIGIWLGNDDNRPMAGVTGGGLPARLFRDIATEITR